MRTVSVAEQRATDLALPEDVAAALAAHPEAKRVFDTMPPSHRREHLRYIDEAKRPDTRQRRIERTIASLTPGE